MPLAVDVLLPIPVPPLRYLVPFGGAAPRPGARVAVPWQNGVRLGVATATDEVDDARALELKEALDVVDPEPYLHPALLAWLPDAARASAAPAGVVLADLAPSGLREPLRHEVAGIPGVEGAPAPDWADASGVPDDRLALWREQGMVRERVRVAVPSVRRLEPAAEADETLAGAARAGQRAALDALRTAGSFESGAALARAAGAPESAVRALVRKGYAAYRERSAPPPPLPRPTAPIPPPEDVPAAPDASPLAVGGGTRRARLASLVPMLRADVDAGGSALVLVPERVLVEETAATLAGADLPVRMHTGASSEPERARLWADLADGPRVLVGTFPALGAPLARLARVVVLEAGRDAYKLPSGSRLVLPEWASRHASEAAAGLILTDALLGPELRAAVADGARWALPREHGRWHRADLTGTRSWPLAADLIRVLRQVEDRDRQAVLLAGRRGFSAALGCASCGWSAVCPNCSLSLRYHQRQRRLRCHQCGHHEAPPPTCPDCGGVEVRAQSAAGAEWVAEAVAGVAPRLPLLRFDADRRDELASLYAGEPGVVVGTTALLRLAPLPRLSLIGVVHLDGMLHLDDFRAEERTLRTLLNLRELSAGPPPLTVLQTFHPEHPLLDVLAAPSDEALDAYLNDMDERRRRLGYPPYARLARVQFSAKGGGRAVAAATEAAERLRTAGAAESEVLGPAPAPVSRVRGRDVMQLLVRAPDDARLSTLLDALELRPSGVRVRVDAHPRDVGAWLE